MKKSKEAQQTLELSKEYKELAANLQFILTEDCYDVDFYQSASQFETLYALITYNLAFLTEDGRVLLTPSGEKTLIKLISELYYM